MQIPDHLRGRVMSIYTLVLLGFMPLGSLLAGSLAVYIGEPGTVMVSAIVLLCFSGLVWTQVPALRKLS